MTLAAWRNVYEVASREPHFRILGAARSGEWFEHDHAAKANHSTAQSVSRPLADLERQGLLETRRGGRRNAYRLTPGGEAIRDILLHGPQIAQGVWLATIAIGDANPAAVRKTLEQMERVSIWRSAGDFSCVVAASGEGADDVVEDLLNEIRKAGAAAAAALVTRSAV